MSSQNTLHVKVNACQACTKIKESGPDPLYALLIRSSWRPPDIWISIQNWNYIQAWPAPALPTHHSDKFSI